MRCSFTGDQYCFMLIKVHRTLVWNISFSMNSINGFYLVSSMFNWRRNLDILKSSVVTKFLKLSLKEIIASEEQCSVISSGTLMLEQSFYKKLFHKSKPKSPGQLWSKLKSIFSIQNVGFNFKLQLQGLNVNFKTQIQSSKYSF